MCNQVEREKRERIFVVMRYIYMLVVVVSLLLEIFVWPTFARTMNIRCFYLVLPFSNGMYVCECAFVYYGATKYCREIRFFFLYFPQFNCYYCWGKMKLYTLHWKTTRQPNIYQAPTCVKTLLRLIEIQKFFLLD